MSGKKLRPFGSLDTDPSPNSHHNNQMTGESKSSKKQSVKLNKFRNVQAKFEKLSKQRSIESLDARDAFANQNIRSKSPLRRLSKDHSQTKLKPLSKSPNRHLKSGSRNRLYQKQKALIANVDLVSHPAKPKQYFNTLQDHFPKHLKKEFVPTSARQKPRMFNKFQNSTRIKNKEPVTKSQARKLKLFKSMVTNKSPRRFPARSKVNQSLNIKPIVLDLAEIEEKVRKMQRPESRRKFNQSQRMRITSYLQKTGSFKMNNATKRLRNKQIKRKKKKQKEKQKEKELKLQNENENESTSSLSCFKFEQSIDRNFTMQKCPSCKVYFPLARLNQHFQNCG